MPGFTARLAAALNVSLAAAFAAREGDGGPSGAPDLGPFGARARFARVEAHWRELIGGAQHEGNGDSVGA